MFFQWVCKCVCSHCTTTMIHMMLFPLWDTLCGCHRHGKPINWTDKGKRVTLHFSSTKQTDTVAGSWKTSSSSASSLTGLTPEEPRVFAVTHTTHTYTHTHTHTHTRINQPFICILHCLSQLLQTNLHLQKDKLVQCNNFIIRLNYKWFLLQQTGIKSSLVILSCKLSLLMLKAEANVFSDFPWQKPRTINSKAAFSKVH